VYGDISVEELKRRLISVAELYHGHRRPIRPDQSYVIFIPRVFSEPNSYVQSTW
jgi:hypothetical protein